MAVPHLPGIFVRAGLSPCNPLGSHNFGIRHGLAGRQKGVWHGSAGRQHGVWHGSADCPHQPAAQQNCQVQKHFVAKAPAIH